MAIEPETKSWTWVLERRCEACGLDAAHVRDVFRRFATRVDLMVTETDPVFENWDQDTTAIADRYAEQDPATVLRELRSDAMVLAEAFRSVPDHALERRGRRSDGSAFTVETLGQYFIHDPVHHLFDVTGQRFPADLP